MIKNKKIKFIVIVCKWILLYSLFISFGFILGMIYQQVLFTQELAKVLSYTEINIDFNATKFSEELQNKFIPAFKEAFNQTIVNSFKNET